MIGQSNHEIQIESKTIAADRHTSLNDTNDPTQVNSLQVDMRTLEKNFVRKVRRNVDGVMTTVETKAQNAVLTVIENLVLPRVELAMKSVNASSGHRVGGAVLDPDGVDFSGNIEGLQLTTSNRINSHTDWNRIDETRGNTIVEEGDLSVNWRNIDRQTHTHHSSLNFM